MLDGLLVFGFVAFLVVLLWSKHEIRVERRAKIEVLNMDKKGYKVVEYPSSGAIKLWYCDRNGRQRVVYSEDSCVKMRERLRYLDLI